ncbi:type VII secretion system-associated protein [Streptomyces zaomyceticus]|uniref:type VII secretion system-associated protein n=1 Tax=Streptomyces zaomyceticus TaxID=68286 RepID=UPI003678AC9F
MSNEQPANFAEDKQPANSGFAEDEQPANFAEDERAADNGKGVEPTEWAQVTPPDEVPPAPDLIVRAASLAPEHYFMMPDPNWDGDPAAPPSWAIIGRWRSDAEGRIVDWEDNMSYRPSPEALGWGEPFDDMDRAVQRSVTGYGTTKDVMSELFKAELRVFLTESGEPELREDANGVDMIAVFSNPPEEQAAELPPHRAISLDEIREIGAKGIPLLYLSPTAPVSLAIMPTALEELREDVVDSDDETELDHYALDLERMFPSIGRPVDSGKAVEVLSLPELPPARRPVTSTTDITSFRGPSPTDFSGEVDGDVAVTES